MIRSRGSSPEFVAGRYPRFICCEGRTRRGARAVLNESAFPWRAIEQIPSIIRQTCMIQFLITSVFALVALASVAGTLFVTFNPQRHPGVCLRR